MKEIEFDVVVSPSEKEGQICAEHVVVNRNGKGKSPDGYRGENVKNAVLLAEDYKIDTGTKSTQPVSLYLVGMTYHPLFDSAEAYPALILYVKNGFDVAASVDFSKFKIKGETSTSDVLGNYCYTNVPAKKNMLVVWTPSSYARQKSWSNINAGSFHVYIQPEGGSIFGKDLSADFKQLDLIYD